jgi:hypothetical protein
MRGTGNDLNGAPGFHREGVATSTFQKHHGAPRLREAVTAGELLGGRKTPPPWRIWGLQQAWGFNIYENKQQSPK